jgi:hypothetical protein
MTTRRYDSNLFQPNAPQMGGQPGRAFAHVARMLWLITDGGKTDELFQFSDEARAMPASIGKSAKRFHDA